ncbi:MAG: cytochrome P450 [Myxococcota bacterium]|nr:cytochrome P450 [Myxococcota bacterium]
MDLNVEFLASENWDDAMLERLTWMREHEPVHWSDKDQLWIATRFDDVAAISKDQDLFTSALGVRPGTPAKIGLIDEGEPRHTALRKLINKGFTPRMVAKLETVFREIVKEALDAIGPQGECDFVEEVAVPLPLLLIAEMIGIRREDRKRFHRWSDAMIAGDGNHNNPEIMAAAVQSFVEYSTYVGEIIEDRRRNPQDDLVSILVGAKDDGVLGNFDVKHLGHVDVSDEHMELANDELIMLLVILMVAGNETTRNGISGGLQLLIEHPDQRQKLLDEPRLIPSAVEEMVRMVSPVRSFSRTATRDTVLRGREILEGQHILMIYPTANRDPRVFADPDRFDVERNPHHLGFGLGKHFCLGANLARMEMRVAFEQILERFPDMEYAAGGPVMKPSALVRTCARMDVRYTPEAS